MRVATVESTTLLGVSYDEAGALVRADNEKPVKLTTASTVSRPS
jgi:hypothetical protein